jgi:tRNA G37 N-methylase Trm5
VPSSFESVGHIAHLNLREDLLPYKHVIGQVRLLNCARQTLLLSSMPICGEVLRTICRLFWIKTRGSNLW